MGLSSKFCVRVVSGADPGFFFFKRRAPKLRTDRTKAPVRSEVSDRMWPLKSIE